MNNQGDPETTSSTEAFRQVPAMLCPPAGRGTHGTLFIGRGHCEFVSEDVDITGKPFLRIPIPNGMMQNKAKFGGRIDLDTGYYLVMGSKRKARWLLENRR